MGIKNGAEKDFENSAPNPYYYPKKNFYINVKVPYAEWAILYTPAANLKKPQGTYGAEGGGFEPPVP